LSNDSKQQQAIADYLDALLEDVSDEASAEPVVVLKEAQPITLGLEQLIEAIPETPDEARVDVEVIEAEAIVIEPVVVPVIESVIEAAEAPVEQPILLSESIVPERGAEPFQCLLFKVAGLTLAVPLIKLKSVMPWSERIVETPNQTEWYLGLVQNHGTNVKVIDTALMVLPENRRALLSETLEDRFSHILLVNDGQWGLACESIGDVIWLSTDKVKWRKNKIRRPWLAGTALDYLCALMDTDAFATMLNEQGA